MRAAVRHLKQTLMHRDYEEEAFPFAKIANIRGNIQKKIHFLVVSNTIIKTNICPS